MGEDSLDYLTYTYNQGNFLRISKIILEERTKYQKLILAVSPIFGKLLFLDDVLQISQADEAIYHEMMIHPGAISVRAPLKRALILGGGDGCALRELFKYKSLKEAILVDIDSRVVEISKEHLKDINKGSLEESRANVLITDAIAYVKDSIENEDNRFELIVMDLVDAIGKGSYFGSMEFFSMCKQLLSKGGVLVTHGSFLTDFPYACGLYQTLSKLFKYVRMNVSAMPSFGQSWGFIVCSDDMDPANINPEEAVKKTSGMSFNHYIPENHNSYLVLSNMNKSIVDCYAQDGFSIGQKNEISKFSRKIEK